MRAAGACASSRCPAPESPCAWDPPEGPQASQPGGRAGAAPPGGAAGPARPCRSNYLISRAASPCPWGGRRLLAPGRPCKGHRGAGRLLAGPRAAGLEARGRGLLAPLRTGSGSPGRSGVSAPRSSSRCCCAAQPDAGGVAMSMTVNLTGPAPWGFRITGGRDFRKPITVSKVMEHGKAAAGDLRPGDIIVSINGDSTADMLNVEAQNKIKQSSGRLQLQVDRSQLFSPGQTNGESSPEMLAMRFQDVVRTRDDSQGSVRSSYSSPASLSPRPGSPFSSSSPGYRPGSPYSPQRPSLPSEGRGETVACSRSFQSLASSPSVFEDRSPSPHRHQHPGSRQERGSLCHPSNSPVAALPLINRTPSPLGPWEMGRAPGRASPSYSPRNSLDSELAMRRLEEDSEVYKMMQENREIRAAPRQSNTFRLLQVALETDGGAGTTTPFPSKLSPSTHKPVTSSVAGVQKLHTCEKCGTGITTQAVRIQESRYRHPSCYICADCGLNLKMRGHFWVGEELYCEKHARQRYQGLGEGAAAATAISSKS